MHSSRLEFNEKKPNTKLDFYYKTINHIQNEISEIKSTLIFLTKKMADLDQETLLPCQQFSNKSMSDTLATVAAGSTGVITGGMAGASGVALKGALLPIFNLPTLPALPALKTLLAMGACGASGAVVAIGTLASYSLIKKYYFPYNIEYKGIPFEKINTTYNGGKFVVIDSKPEQGIYKAQFYPDLYSDSSYLVEILLPKNKFPDTMKSIEELFLAITDQEELLKRKKDELSQAIKEKDLYIKEILYKPKPRPSSILPASESKELTIPEASDSKAILNYLETIKELNIPSDTQKDTILLLLKNEKFVYDNNYSNIITKLNDIGLLNDPDIFQLIAQHPEKETARYSNNLPLKLHSFWAVMSLKESYEHVSKKEWKKSFEKEIQRRYPKEDEENMNLRTFAYCLTKQ